MKCQDKHLFISTLCQALWNINNFVGSVIFLNATSEWKYVLKSKQILLVFFTQQIFFMLMWIPGLSIFPGAQQNNMCAGH